MFPDKSLFCHERIVLGLLALLIPLASCSQRPLAEASANGATVRLARACSDASTTVLQLQTVLDISRWQLEPDDFSSPNAAYFVTSISFLQDGLAFSSTSSSHHSRPEVDVEELTATVEQEFVFPGHPAAGSVLSLKASVTLFNAPGIRLVAADLEMPVLVSECE